MLKVIIESPYAGDVQENIEYARQCLLDSLNRGEAPIASHLLHTQVLDDNEPEQRKTGINAGHAWLGVADVLAVYTDLGVSPGMFTAISKVTDKAKGPRIEFRSLRGGV